MFSVINAEKSCISGNAKKIVLRYGARRTMRNMADPETSAKWPRRPDMLFKKIVSGMLPKHSATGAKALKNLRVYIGVPKELEGKPAEKAKKQVSQLKGKSITLEKICADLGWVSKLAAK